jgi:hypothetical protein
MPMLLVKNLGEGLARDQGAYSTSKELELAR